jgi:hypothetical protein
MKKIDWLYLLVVLLLFITFVAVVTIFLFRIFGWL